VSEPGGVWFSEAVFDRMAAMPEVTTAQDDARPPAKRLEDFDLARPRVRQKLERNLTLAEWAFGLTMTVWVIACWAGLILGLLFDLGELAFTSHLVALVGGSLWLNRTVRRRCQTLRDEIEQLKAEHKALTGEEL
jgi:hypothetical protein